MRFLRLCLTSALFTSLVSCDSKCQKCASCEPSNNDLAVTNSQENEPKLEAEELLRALGGHAFTVIFPEDLPQQFYVSCVLKYPDGSIKPSGRMSTTNANKQARVFLFPTDGGYKTQILLANGSTGTTIDIPPHTVTMFQPQGTTVKVGDGLIRFAEEGSDGASSGRLREGNFDIAFHISPVEE